MKGWGLKLKKPVKAGSFLIEYTGELINNKMCIERIKQEHLRATKATKFKKSNSGGKKGGKKGGKNSKMAGKTSVARETANNDRTGLMGMNFYFLTISEDVILDASHKGQVFRAIRVIRVITMML